MRWLTALCLSADLLAAVSASAQAEATLVPSVAVSTVHDDNLFSAPTAVGDLMTSVRPSLEALYTSPTVKVQSLVSIDLQRSARHSALNTFDARRHAMFDGRVQASPVIQWGLIGRYDRTETPGELNLDSGLLLERQRAHRLQVTPSVAYRTTPRTTVSSSYDWTTEALTGFGGNDLHAAQLAATFEVSPRTTVTARYLGRLFADDGPNNHSHAALIGWARDTGPGASLSVQAGPRARSYGGVSAEVLAAFIKRTPRSRLVVDYWQGETIVLGILGPVQVQSGTTKFNWTVRRWVELGAHVGVFESTTLDRLSARVVHASLIGAWSRPPYIFSVSYGSDVQKGDIRSRGAADETVRRGVFVARLTVAPRLSRAFRPADGGTELTTPLKGVIE